MRAARIVSVVTCMALAPCGAATRSPGASPLLLGEIPRAGDGDVDVRWSTSGRALVGDHWLGAHGITSLDCEDRSGWAELRALETPGGALPACGRPRAHRPLLCTNDGVRCLRVGADAIVLVREGHETRLLDVLPEDVLPFSPRLGEEVVLHIGQRDASGAPARDMTRYGARAMRTYRFSFATGRLEELSDDQEAALQPVAILDHRLTRVARADGTTCLTRDAHERCYQALYEVVSLPDGALVAFHAPAPASGSTVVRLDEALEERFRFGPVGAADSAVLPVPRPDGTILIAAHPEAVLLDGDSGAELRRYPMNTQYDDATHSTGVRLSADGTRSFSCLRDTLVVRDGSTGRVEARFARSCDLDDDGESRTVPLPSPDGCFAALLCRDGTPCIVRTRGGAALLLGPDLSAARVRSFFMGR